MFHVEVREPPTIYSNQEQTDTRMVLYLHCAVALAWTQERNNQNPGHRYLRDSTLPRPRHQTVYYDIGSGKHQQLINISDLAVPLGEDYCATLLGIYVISGGDCTSAFKGPLKKMEKHPRLRKAFRQLGEE